MRKRLIHLMPVILAFALLAIPFEASAGVKEKIVETVIGAGTNVIGVFVSPIVVMLLTLTSFLTMIAGVILNAAVHFSVVKMSAGITNLPAVDVAWTAIRDIANMGFIFVLLYTAIQTIFGQGNYRETIKNIIIAAVLINFSLFFTKVIIDASNLLALTFYDAIAPGAAASADYLKAGISNAIVEPMGITTLFKASGGWSHMDNFAVTGIMGSVVLLISAFMFFAMAIMFIIRYVVLVFVMILSPIAFVANVLPGLQGKAKQWWDALLGQAFFAPIFFLLMWISIIMIKGIITASLYANGNGAKVNDWSVALSGSIQTTAAGTSVNYESGMISAFINFAIIIGFLITSLITAKKFAGMAGAEVSKFTGWATGKASNFAMGTVVGGGLRNTVGRAAARAAENPNLINNANNRTGFAGAGARLALFASQRAADATFDMRNARIPTQSAAQALGIVASGALDRDSVRNSRLAQSRVGRAIGLDNFDVNRFEAGVANKVENIPNIYIGAQAAGQTGVGEAEKKGFRENQKEDKKKEAEFLKERSLERRLAEATKAIESGIKPTAGGTEIAALEKAIASLTDKEIEAIVEGNKDLLENQTFATKISVQQLEALNKSDKFNEDQKDSLKKNRFKSINDEIDRVRTTPGATISGPIKGAIKGLSDKELEMIDPSHLSDENFIAELRSAQIESISKSSKFTPTQKKTIKDTRTAPLIRALDTAATGYNSDPNLVSEFITKKLSPKDVAGLMSKNITHAGTTKPLLTHPDVLAALTPNILKRMAPEMVGADIAALRTALLAAHPPGSRVNKWLNSEEGLSIFD